MRIVARSPVIMACIALGTITAGCGDASGPRLAPVEGAVTLNGKPLEEATVSFVPDPSNREVTPGLGVSGEDGTFKVQHNGRFGLALGKYKVLISKTGSAKPGVTVPEAFANDPIQQRMMGIRKETLPKKYSDPATSTEIVEVKDGRTATISTWTQRWL